MLGFSTRAIWSGQDACTSTGATIVPVYQTATFTLPQIGVTKGFDYSRTINPTRLAMERQLAALEDGSFASAFGSGMAAVAGATSLLSKKTALDGVLKRMEAEALPKSKQVLDVTSAAFNRGELKLTDVLLARRTHIDLTLKHMDLQFETFNVRNDLRRVLGLDADLARGIAAAPRS